MRKIDEYIVVFEGEGTGWCIIRDEVNNSVLIATHVACKPEDVDEYNGKTNEPDQDVLSWFHNEEDALCYYCGKPVPDEIQALIHLSSSF